MKTTPIEAKLRQMFHLDQACGILLQYLSFCNRSQNLFEHLWTSTNMKKPLVLQRFRWFLKAKSKHSPAGVTKFTLMAMANLAEAKRQRLRRKGHRKPCTKPWWIFCLCSALKTLSTDLTCSGYFTKSSSSWILGTQASNEDFMKTSKQRKQYLSNKLTRRRNSNTRNFQRS